MTTQPIGTCLGLTQLTSLIVPSNTSANASMSFSGQLSRYLQTVCGGTECASKDLDAAKAQLEGSCDGRNKLVKAVVAVMDGYRTTYRTLACSVH